VRDEKSRRRRSRNFEAEYIGPYKITRIEGPNLVLIPKFEVGGKVILRVESVRRGRY
jgi:hypothetical protein